LLSTIKLNEMLTRDMLRAAFRMFDLDNDGWVTFEEIRAVLKGNGV
jgi:Ca2+-binding EF-hand superfamily protein